MILAILLIVGALNITWFLIKLLGRVLGGVFGFAGFLIIGILGVTVLGLASMFLPAIIIIGIVALISSIAKKC